MPSFILHTLSGRLLHCNEKIKRNSKAILELQLWIFWFVKKMLCWIITSGRWFCSVYGLEHGSVQIVDSITIVNSITIYATHGKQRFLLCWCSLKGLLNQTHLILYRLFKKEKLGKEQSDPEMTRRNSLLHYLYYSWLAAVLVIWCRFILWNVMEETTKAAQERFLETLQLYPGGQLG